ncbi:hypothetical protein [Dyadobacter luticola]|uniref:hypothetical protein n=1 Tax=Dyadobacter luticola TaxID=1979387 RepID=UPI0014874942|nr:hypothetical protein [Dyadobacter luticola]
MNVAPLVPVGSGIIAVDALSVYEIDEESGTGFTGASLIVTVTFTFGLSQASA